jgi:hypothetical protein
MREIIGNPQNETVETLLFQPTKILKNSYCFQEVPNENTRVVCAPSKTCIGTFEVATALKIAQQLRKDGFTVKSKARGPRSVHKHEIRSCYNTRSTCNFDLPLKFATMISLYVYDAEIS